MLIKESLKPFCKHFPAKKQNIYIFFLTAFSLRKAPSVALVVHFTLKVSDFILFPSAGRHEAPSPLSLNWPRLLRCATPQSSTTSRKVPHRSTHTAARATRQRRVQCQLYAFELNQLSFQRQGEGYKQHKQRRLCYTDQTKHTVTAWQILLHCTETAKATRLLLLTGTER